MANKGSGKGNGKTALGRVRMVRNPEFQFGTEETYWHVAVETGGMIRHLVLTERQYAEGQARAERGLELLPDVPWWARIGPALWTMLKG